MHRIIEFINFLTPYGFYSYWVMLGFLLACGFGLPMPEDVILISGGILSARKVCDLWLTNVVCMIGVLLGDGIVYFLGRRYGPQIKSSWLFRRMMRPEVDIKISHIFAKYGDKVVFMGRFMPGLRMPIFLTAGTYHLSAIKFFVLDGFAALISVPLWIWVGYFFGNNLELLEKKIKHFQMGIYGILIIVISLFIISYFAKKKVLQKF